MFFRRFILTGLLACSALSLFAEGEANLKIVDVLISYDTSARNILAEDGVWSEESFARWNIDKMNRCLENSGLSGDFSFRLAGIHLIDEDTSDLTLYQILTQKVKNKAAATGEWKKLWTARDTARADLFSVVTGGAGDGALGYGYTLGTSSGQYGVSEKAGLVGLKDADWLKRCADNYCFNVLSLNALLREDDYTMAHEIGHNMGCGHPEEIDGANGQRYYDFSCGRYFGDYVTVMGYVDGGHAVAPVFSSPTVSYDGMVTGDSAHDNVRTLRNNYQFVAKYRASASDQPSEEEDDPAEEEVDPDEAWMGGFAPSQAVNGVFPYCGAVMVGDGDDAAVCGVIQLKVGKMSKKGEAKVAGTVMLLDGKKYSIKSTAFKKTAKGPSTVKGILIKKVGMMDLTIGSKGFVAAIRRDADGAVLSSVSENITAGLSSKTAYFSIKEGFFPKELNGAQVVAACTPSGERITVSGTKWVLDKAASIKYKKITEKNPETGVKTIHFDMVGLDDPKKPNRSGLKLTYNAKVGSFKGSFSVYTDVGTEVKPKFKKTSFSVFGFVIDGKGAGIATCKKPELQMPVTIK